MSADRLQELFRLFSVIKHPREAELLLTDLLTPRELGSLAKRWELLRELAHGTRQRAVAKKLKLSISKITRGSRVLRHGTGASLVFLKRLGAVKG